MWVTKVDEFVEQFVDYHKVVPDTLLLHIFEIVLENLKNQSTTIIHVTEGRLRLVEDSYFCIIHRSYPKLAYGSMYGPLDHSVTGLFVHFSGHHAVNGLFGYWTNIHHLNTGRVQALNAY